MIRGKGHLRRSLWRLAALVVAGFFLLQPLSVAEAGWFERIKEIYQLPEHVEDIHQKYDSTKQQLEEQMGKLVDQSEQLAAQQDKLVESIRTSELLMEQNRQLQEQNDELRQRLSAMEQAAEAKNASMRKLTSIGITAILLVIGYFVLGRLLRVVLWRRHKGKLPIK